MTLVVAGALLVVGRWWANRKAARAWADVERCLYGPGLSRHTQEVDHRLRAIRRGLFPSASWPRHCAPYRDRFNSWWVWLSSEPRSEHRIASWKDPRNVWGSAYFSGLIGKAEPDPGVVAPELVVPRFDAAKMAIHDSVLDDCALAPVPVAGKPLAGLSCRPRARPPKPAGVPEGAVVVGGLALFTRWAVLNAATLGAHGAAPGPARAVGPVLAGSQLRQVCHDGDMTVVAAGVDSETEAFLVRGQRIDGPVRVPLAGADRYSWGEDRSARLWNCHGDGFSVGWSESASPDAIPTAYVARCTSKGCSLRHVRLALWDGGPQRYLRGNALAVQPLRDTIWVAWLGQDGVYARHGTLDQLASARDVMLFELEMYVASRGLVHGRAWESGDVGVLLLSTKREVGPWPDNTSTYALRFTGDGHASLLAPPAKGKQP